MAGLNHGWGSEDSRHADFLHNGVDEKDFEDTVPYRKKRGKSRPKKKRGCPDNDYKAHVYVWDTHTEYHYKWNDYGGLVRDKTRPYTVEVKICCGCNKIVKRKFNW